MENQQKFEFMTEKVKDRPINKKKLMRRTLITASMAIIFGLIACLTFAFLEPVISNWLHPQGNIEKIEIPLVSEEILPEDMMEHEEVSLELSQEMIDTLRKEIDFTTKDFQNLYQVIRSLVLELQNAQVTVTGTSKEVDFFQSAYETKGSSIGYLFAQNDNEIMILVTEDSILGNEVMEVSFVDGSIASATIRGTDRNTGLAVVAVEKNQLSSNTKEAISFLNLGNSNVSTLLASPVIALGNPLGHTSVVYGMITSADQMVSMSDCNYKLLTTDIYGSKDATGILVDFDGKLIGIINQNFNSKETANLISALGISEIRVALQRMSNGLENTYIGIQGTEVPEEVANSKNVPLGVYVKGIDLDSPAMQAGIQSGDIIIRMENSQVTSVAEYTKVLHTWTVGDTKEISLMRRSQDGYKTAKVQIVIGNLE